MAKKHKKPTSTKQPEIIIQQQNRRSLMMRINPAGQVVVSIPKWVKPDSPHVKKFIAEALERLEQHIPEEQAEPIHTAEDIRKMVAYWAGQMGIDYGRVQLREMTRKWGSCSSNGNITLNIALTYLPDYLAAYVVVHELAHIKVFNHSPQFWALVGQYMPDYETYEKELNTHRV